THFDRGTQIMIAVQLERSVTKDAQAGVTAHRGMRTGAGGVDPRFDFSEIQPRNNGHIEFDVAVQTVNDPDELTSRTQPPAFTHGEEVSQPRLTGTRGEGGDQDEAFGQIFAADPVTADRGDGEISALIPVEQTPEATVGIKTRQTTPVDGAAAGNQRGRVAVADEG